MIRHCVFVRFKQATSVEAKQKIYDDLDALKHVMPGILAASFGANVSPEGVSQGFDDGFIIDFVDADARDAYLVHPDHKKAGANLVAALEDGVNGLLVFDLPIG